MIDLVIPTIGRASLRELFASLANARGSLPRSIFVVDDRQDRTLTLDLGELPESLRERTRILSGRSRGPAAARNVGWRASGADWIAFVDDDVTVGTNWLADLERDLVTLDPAVAGSQGRIDVPLPANRKPTDWERNVAGLADALWITADCAYRRSALAAVGGFDERFPRAYREDADLALRIVALGGRIVWGERRSIHRVREADRWISVRLQAGNADDVLMETLHGRNWYERAGASRGAFGRHRWTVISAFVGLLGIAGWFGLTVTFAAGRIARGPRTFDEIATMLITSALIPFAAVGHRLAGRLRLQTGLRKLPRAVLFDRDGTLVIDVPFNGDPTLVRPMDGAREALARLRSAGIATGIVSNQGGIGAGKIRASAVDAVNARVDALLGPFDTIAYCPHDSRARCACRKPAAGLILAAAAKLGVAPGDCVVVGDIGSDVEAARAAGARAILVPTPVTRAAEIAAASNVAQSIEAAVAQILAGRV